MNRGFEKIARNYLSRHGCHGADIAKYLRGFDLTRPVYEQRLDQGDIIFQYVRRSDQHCALPKIGNWFALSGAGLQDLGINSGGSGRSLVKVEVTLPLTVLESTAGAMDGGIESGLGGAGGATQIFIPDRFLMTHLQVQGYVTV